MKLQSNFVSGDSNLKIDTLCSFISLQSFEMLRNKVNGF